MATPKKQPEKKPEKVKPTPVPCKCGKRAVVIKYRGRHMVCCVGTYCDKSLPVWAATEEAAVKKWNKED